MSSNFLTKKDEENSKIQDQIMAILLQRFYRFKENSKERWGLLVSIIISSILSLVLRYTPELYDANVNNSSILL